MSSELRVTVRNCKGGKDGVFLARHNDRDYDISKDKHIDSNRLKYNKYIVCFKDLRGLSFTEAERRYYETVFGGIVEKRNRNYKKSGHSEKCRTIDEYRQSHRHAPLETIYEVGDRDAQNENLVLRNHEFQYKLLLEQYKWEREMFPQVHWVTAGYHADEIDDNGVLSAYHWHIRKCFNYKTSDGLYDMDVTKCLQQMGIERPDPSQPRDRYNNELQTYTAMCREHYQDLCEEFGLDIIREPREASQSGLRQEEYILRQKRAEAKKVVSEAQREADMIVSKAKVTAIEIQEDAQKRGEQYKQAASRVYQSVCEKECALQQSVTEVKQIRKDLYEKTAHFASFGEDTIERAESLLYNL